MSQISTQRMYSDALEALYLGLNRTTSVCGQA